MLKTGRAHVKSESLGFGPGLGLLELRFPSFGPPCGRCVLPEPIEPKSLKDAIIKL